MGSKLPGVGAMNHQLIIVGGGATHRQVPWFRKDSDYWGLIALAGIMKTCDQWFELHPWSVLGPKDRWRSRRLKPLYMIRRYAHLPHVRQFPMSVFRNHPGAPFTSSFTYQLALAYDLGYSSVRLYGLGDFLTGSARERTVEWAGLLYWIGCWRGWVTTSGMPEPRSPHRPAGAACCTTGWLPPPCLGAACRGLAA